MKDTNHSKLSWKILGNNPNIIPLLERCWAGILQREAAGETANWDNLCYNPNAIPFIEKHWDYFQDKVDWGCLCHNPNAIPLLERHWTKIQDDIYWYHLCGNPNAIPLLERHWSEIQDNIDWNAWNALSRNPAIFELDLAAMRAQARPFAEELAARVFTPARMAAAYAAGVEDDV